MGSSLRSVSEWNGSTLGVRAHAGNREIKMKSSRSAFGVVACVVVGGAAFPALAQGWDETVNGDLTNNRLAPTSVTLGPTFTTISAVTGRGDPDYLTFTIPAGMTLDVILISSFSGNDPMGFMGLQAGTTMTVDPDAPEVGDLLGWTHFGFLETLQGTNLVTQLGDGMGAIGFDGPLPAGTYTLWLQQLGEPMTYTLDFTLVPTPSTALLGGGLGMLATSRRRTRR